MQKVLAPVDGSGNACRVIDYLIKTAGNLKEMEIVLVNVREPVDAPQVRRFWSVEQVREFQLQEGSLLLQPARDRLQAAGLRHTAEVLVGDVAQTIVDRAKAQGCDSIVMGTRGMSSIANLLMGSVATKVVHLAEIPVTLIK